MVFRGCLLLVNVSRFICMLIACVSTFYCVTWLYHILIAFVLKLVGICVVSTSLLLWVKLVWRFCIGFGGVSISCFFFFFWMFPRNEVAGVYSDTMSNLWETVECLSIYLFMCFLGICIFDGLSVHTIHPFSIRLSLQLVSCRNSLNTNPVPDISDRHILFQFWGMLPVLMLSCKVQFLMLMKSSFVSLFCYVCFFVICKKLELLLTIKLGFTPVLPSVTL